MSLEWIKNFNLQIQLEVCACGVLFAEGEPVWGDPPAVQVLMHLCINISTGGCVKHATRGPEPGRQRVQSGPPRVFGNISKEKGAKLDLSLCLHQIDVLLLTHPRSATCHSSAAEFSWVLFTFSAMWVVFSHVRLSRLCFPSSPLCGVSVWVLSGLLLCLFPSVRVSCVQVFFTFFVPFRIYFLPVLFQFSLASVPVFVCTSSQPVVEPRPNLFSYQTS